MNTERRIQVDSLHSNDDEVRATVYSFEGLRIRRFLHQDITILEVSGTYSPALGKQLERHVGQVKNNLGLDLSAVSGLQPGILSTLQKIQRKFRNRSRAFLLCRPPERLIDLLKLNDLLDAFQVTSNLGDLTASESSIVSMLDRDEPESLVDTTPAIDELPVSKEIAQFNHSLKRTEKLEKGLDSASKCIRRILPAQCPTHPDFDFSFSYTPCDKVGGDFFDFIPLGADVLGVSIGDVSGHGLDSAIIMGMAKNIIRVRARDLRNGSPRDVLSQVNRDLHGELGSNIFITALYARVDLRTGVIHFARAGHEPPLLFRPGMRPEVRESRGIAIGIDSGRRFDAIIEEKKLVLRSGAGLLLYTDGIVESWNSRRDLFSRDRLSYTLEKIQRTCAAESVIQRLTDAVEQFAGGIPAEDDMTAIVIMRN